MIFDENNRRKPMKLEDIPVLPRFLSIDDFQQVIPQGYEDIIKAEINLVNPLKPSIVLRVLKAEMRGNSTVEIPQAYFNSKLANVEVCDFIFETSTEKTGVEYFGKDSYLRKNRIEMLYYVLQHRFASFARILSEGKNRRLYVSLLKTDIKRLKDFIDYNGPRTYNALAKVAHLYAVIPYRTHKYSSDQVIGERLGYISISELDWKLIYKDLGKYLQPSSESSMQKSNKIVLNTPTSAGIFSPIYRGLGYSLAKDGSCFTTIFPEAQNIPARLKTHLLSNGYELKDFEPTCFQQDFLFNDGIMTPLDKCTRKAIVVFHPMDNDTLRFVAGELEVSSRIAKALVVETKNFDLEFSSQDDICIEVGQTYKPNFKPMKIGTDVDGEDYMMYGLKEFEVLAIGPNGNAGSFRISLRFIKYSGNARIISKSGLKGVTKVKPGNGFIAFASETKNFETLEDQVLGEYLKAKDYNSWTTVSSDNFKGWKKRNVDIIAGMNAVKAGSNTIALAQAALAVELGYYKPSAKGVNKNYQGIINTLDAVEVQEAADSLPEFVYVNDSGVPVKCFVGLVNIMYTELGSTYAEFKPQSFSFEAGWVIKQNNEELYRHIFDTYVEKDKSQVAIELYKILNDPTCLLAYKEDLPIYRVSDIRKGMFDVKHDLFRERNSLYPSQSKLLSSWNEKGFVIDLSSEGGPLIRIPSAYVLSFFISIMPNSEYSYGEILLNITRIIMSILGRTEENLDNMANANPNTFRPNLTWIFNKDKSNNRQSQYDLYLKNIRGIIYSSESSSQMIVQSFIKPRIPGVSLKQVVDSLVPDDVVVVLDNYLYRKILRQASFSHLLSDEYPYKQLMLDCADYDTNEQRMESREELQSVLDESPLGFLNRNPFLWVSQMKIPKVWGSYQFRAYLNVFHNINLDDYLDDFFNRDIIIMSPKTALDSKSDVDGDLAPLMIPNKVGQELSRNFVNETITEAERTWLADYAQGEYESDKKLKINERHKYQIHTINCQFDPTGVKDKNYPQFLLNSTVAKGNIGGATIDCWLIKLLMQVYTARFNQTKGRLYDQDGKIIGNMKFRLNDDDINYLSHIYTRLVQERVVEGIKHITGGSTAFQIYFLDNITKPANQEIVKQQLENDFDVPPIMIAKLLNVIEYCSYDKSLLTACRSFIKKYNKGKLPRLEADIVSLNIWESFIQENTYFGSLVKPLFDVQKQINELQLEAGNASEYSLSDLIGETLSTQTNNNASDNDPDLGYESVLY